MTLSTKKILYQKEKHQRYTYHTLSKIFKYVKLGCLPVHFLLLLSFVSNNINTK